MAAAPQRILEKELATFQNVGRVMWHPDGKRMSFRASRPTHPADVVLERSRSRAARPCTRMSPTASQQEMKTQGVGILNARWAPAGDAPVYRGDSPGHQEPLADRRRSATLGWIGGPVRLTTGAGIDAEMAISARRQAGLRDEDGDVAALVACLSTRGASCHRRGRRRSRRRACRLRDGPVDERHEARVRGAAAWKARHGAVVTSLDSGQQACSGEDVGVLRPRLSRDGISVAARITREGLEGRRLAWYTVCRGGEQLLPRGPTNPVDWSADGERMLHFCLSPDKDRRHLCVDVGQRPRVRPTWAARGRQGLRIWQGRYSPDGRWILFNAQSLKQAGVSILGVVPAAGGKWTPLTDPKLWADKARWAPDGRAIYFISNRDSAFFDVWGIEFDSAKGAMSARNSA